jgi:CelD/BcsL family acetyltransferase involved in cellulose biosynthesis
VQVLGSASDLALLRKEWEELASRCPGHRLAQRHRWSAVAWRTVAEPRGRRLHILTLRSAGKLVGVWPLVSYLDNGLRLVRQLGAESSEYTEPLVEPGPRHDEWLEGLWNAARPLGDLLLMTHVRSDRPFARLPRRHPLRCFVDNELNAPQVLRAAYSDWQAYLATVTTSHKSDLRRKRRRLSEIGEITFRREETSVDPATIDAILGHKQAWISHRSLRNDWLAQPDYRDFLCAMTADPCDRDSLSLFVLRVGETPVAFQINAVDDCRVEGLVGAQDPAWRRYSTGDLLMQECLHWAFQHHRDVDFRIGGESYKATWARQDCLTFNCLVGLSQRGMAVVWLRKISTPVKRLRFRLGLGRFLRMSRGK